MLKFICLSPKRAWRLYKMKNFCLEVSGPFACFTRPEMKVERVSYDVITPSAARAIYEAILWKPEIRWHIRRIDVLNPIRWFSIRRNEVKKKIPIPNLNSGVNNNRQLGIYIEKERTQRASLLLRDVRYCLYADLEVRNDTPVKYCSMFERRASKGQCFHQPYLGCREFDARFRLIDKPIKEFDSSGLDEKIDLGWMLYDLDFTQPDNPQPRFFHAVLVNGVLNVPHWDSKEVRQ